MKSSLRMVASIAMLLLGPSLACATPDKNAACDDWVVVRFEGEADSLPISFTFGGKPSAVLLKTWRRERSERRLDENRRQLAITYTDPQSGLIVRCIAVQYRDFPAVEWTAYFKHGGTSDTPILEDLQGIDASFNRGTDGEFVLHGIKGDFCTADSFEPYQQTLAANTVTKFAPPAHSGKSSDGPKGWPYYNLQFSGGGVILAVGWPGQWSSTFTRNDARGLRIRAGQELTRLRLRPGEEIRTPLIAMLFWQGADFVEAQNLWRRWYIVHNLPRVGNKPQPVVTQIQVAGKEADIAYVQKYLDAGIRVDLCWRDAGGSPKTTWFPDTTGPFQTPRMAWLNTGTWSVDRAKYPNGFRPFTDWIHARGMQFVLWFEPERVGNPASWLGKQHPEWLLPGTSHGALLDEGNAEARKWLVEHVSGLIKSEGIDWYREDMNGSGPLRAWRKHDAPDRQGMTENIYVQGHLAFWDELRRRHPGLRIDSCASGGRRNDLETMRRAVPLLRSDFQFADMPGVVEGNQGHTYGLSFWLPFQGTGCYVDTPYGYRSFYLPSFGMSRLTEKNTAAHQKAYAECRDIAPLMLADYYPLTPYSRELNRWIAWQFHRPDVGEGLVQTFRRPDAADDTLTVKLRGLDPNRRYEIRDFDGGTTVRSGSELMNGYRIRLVEKPAAALLRLKIFP